MGCYIVMFCNTINEKMTEEMRVGVPTRSGALPYVKTHPRKTGKIEAARLKMAREKSESQSRQDVMIHLG